MDLKTEIREYFYKIHGSHIETDIANIIAIAEKHIALQLQQTGVSTCFLEDYEDHFFEVKYKQVSCCKIAPITNENYCPNCGKKILK